MGRTLFLHIKIPHLVKSFSLAVRKIQNGMCAIVVVFREDDGCLECRYLAAFLLKSSLDSS